VAENFGWEATAVSVEVEAGVVSGRGTDPAGGANLGIGCMSSRSSGYAGGVGTNGAWAIMRIDRALTPLANALPGTLTTRSGTNRLRLVCSRLDDATTVVKFAVGGEEVGVVRDTHRAERFNGVLLYADTFPGVVTFERFDARRPADQPDTRR
jgi:hypothetical protein